MAALRDSVFPLQMTPLKVVPLLSKMYVLIRSFVSLALALVIKYDMYLLNRERLSHNFLEISISMIPYHFIIL